jgi:tRNA threonylcarbamoyladenosine modification (KEOPS) complex  Pcc1 subunit
MIKVSMEVREGAALSIATVQAESIREAVNITRGRYPGRDVRVIFPIDAENFFIEGSAEDNSRTRPSMVAAAE